MSQPYTSQPIGFIPSQSYLPPPNYYQPNCPPPPPPSYIAGEKQLSEPTVPYPMPQSIYPPAYPPVSTAPNFGPQNDGCMLIPPSFPSCPPGLEYLTQIDQILVQQKVELLESFIGFETSNKYTIKNSMGQKIYSAKEDSFCCTRIFLGSKRMFDLKIYDNNKKEVLHLYRPFRCDSCFFPCFLQKITVSAPPGNVIGYVKQQWSICLPKFEICNAAGKEVLKIQGPFCTFSCCGDVNFSVMTLNGTEVGRIVKQWSGLLRETFTDADHFGISFPIDLDVNMKAVLIGALFLIDYMFFESTAGSNKDRPGMLD